MSFCCLAARLGHGRLDYVLVDSPSKFGMIAEHYDVCRRANKAGAAVIAEGAA